MIWARRREKFYCLKHLVERMIEDARADEEAQEAEAEKVLDEYEGHREWRRKRWTH